MFDGVGMKANPEYIEKVKGLTKREIEYLLSRSPIKARKIEKRKVSIEDVLAMQLEIEDELLQEWRENFKLIKEKDELHLKSK